MEAVESELDKVPAGLQADYCAHRVIDHYESPDVEEARRWRRRIDEISPPVPPIRRWHALMFDALVKTDAGEAAQAKA